ncbi:hypothetical protein GCM10011490_18960 [Pseudoclavibacter endophyticus]|uniref:DUF3566 domain-containing protein n=1 Tax=Pseudoclavibacter endophyticus TaxID=1778590 RepID=A0A6H9WL49_9MICO|nr:DUF3566 domain-containing protein [Pseudoclavibacter endophyticus]KAB1648768.1 DUF3566 domain-containing protein [Pseudoclavibacter endophyticus]GGA68680.1 hypothetical protein GCM10011490_18960 [Pseudoclavibacter endophyticus]
MTSVAEKLAKKSTRKTASKQVRLRLVHVDFWSAVKLALLVSACGVVVALVTVALLWTVLVQTGVFDSVNSLLNDVSGTETVSISNFVEFGPLMVAVAVVSLLNLVAFTALTAVAAFFYNLSVKITGGLVFGFTNS